MAKTIGYMITWTTYGTWLQGDKRGYAKNSKIYSANRFLRDSNKKQLRKKPFYLNRKQRKVVKRIIHVKAEEIDQRIYALFVGRCHVHIVAGYVSRPISDVVRKYKNATHKALFEETNTKGKAWTRGYDKRYCYDRERLEQRIHYVSEHRKE